MNGAGVDGRRSRVRAAFTRCSRERSEIMADQDSAATRRVLDVGAHVGWFALAARGHFPRAAIHAYEPNAAAVAFLRRNTEALGVIAHSEAIGASAGWVSLTNLTGRASTRTLRTAATSRRPRSSMRSPASAVPIWSSSNARAARSGRSWTIPRRGPVCGG